MAEASDTLGILRQNLIDAGCDRELVGRCITLAQEKKTGELLLILSRHRRTLLDGVHQREKQIDCLDFLIYQINRTQQIGGIST